jgi:hypothetical protein
MKFNGTHWVNVGTAGFSVKQANWTSLAFSPSGKPSVAYSDGSESYKATVMEFDGTEWLTIKNEGFSAGEADFTSLALSPFGSQPYVAYDDCGNSCKASVMKFDGNNWVYVGPQGFSLGTVQYTSFAFGQDSQPYVAYSDWGNARKATVMKYDSVSVGIGELRHSQISLYPNPATDKITIEISGEREENNLAIVNIEDQELIRQKISGWKTQIDISSLPPGIYFLKLTGERLVQVEKIIIL